MIHRALFVTPGAISQQPLAGHSRQCSQPTETLDQSISGHSWLIGNNNPCAMVYPRALFRQAGSTEVVEHMSLEGHTEHRLSPSQGSSLSWQAERRPGATSSESALRRARDAESAIGQPEVFQDSVDEAGGLGLRNAIHDEFQTLQFVLRDGETDGVDAESFGEDS